MASRSLREGGAPAAASSSSSSTYVYKSNFENVAISMAPSKQFFVTIGGNRTPNLFRIRSNRQQHGDAVPEAAAAGETSNNNVSASAPVVGRICREYPKSRTSTQFPYTIEDCNSVGGQRNFTDVSWSPYGDRIAGALSVGGAVVFDSVLQQAASGRILARPLAKGAPLPVYQQKRRCYQVRWDPHHPDSFAISGSDTRFALCDYRAPNTVLAPQNEARSTVNNTHDLAFSPFHEYAIAVAVDRSNGGNILLYDLRSPNKPMQSLDTDGAAQTVSFHPYFADMLCFAHSDRIAGNGADVRFVNINADWKAAGNMKDVELLPTIRTIAPPRRVRWRPLPDETALSASLNADPFFSTGCATDPNRLTNAKMATRFVFATCAQNYDQDLNVWDPLVGHHPIAALKRDTDDMVSDFAWINANHVITCSKFLIAINDVVRDSYHHHRHQVTSSVSCGAFDDMVVCGDPPAYGEYAEAQLRVMADVVQQQDGKLESPTNRGQMALPSPSNSGPPDNMGSFDNLTGPPSQLNLETQFINVLGGSVLDHPVIAAPSNNSLLHSPPASSPQHRYGHPDADDGWSSSQRRGPAARSSQAPAPLREPSLSQSMPGPSTHHHRAASDIAGGRAPGRTPQPSDPLARNRPAAGGNGTAAAPAKPAVSSVTTTDTKTNKGGFTGFWDRLKNKKKPRETSVTISSAASSGTKPGSPSSADATVADSNSTRPVTPQTQSTNGGLAVSPASHAPSEAHSLGTFPAAFPHLPVPGVSTTPMLGTTPLLGSTPRSPFTDRGLHGDAGGAEAPSSCDAYRSRQMWAELHDGKVLAATRDLLPEAPKASLKVLSARRTLLARDLYTRGALLSEGPSRSCAEQLASLYETCIACNAANSSAASGNSRVTSRAAFEFPPRLLTYENPIDVTLTSTDASSAASKEEIRRIDLAAARLLGHNAVLCKKVGAAAASPDAQQLPCEAEADVTVADAQGAVYESLLFAIASGDAQLAVMTAETLLDDCACQGDIQTSLHLYELLMTWWRIRSPHMSNAAIARLAETSVALNSPTSDAAGEVEDGGWYVRALEWFDGYLLLLQALSLPVEIAEQKVIFGFATGDRTSPVHKDRREDNMKLAVNFLRCGRCFTELQPSQSSAPARCHHEQCRDRPAAICVICERPVTQGHFTWLRPCGHGGHEHHIAEWLKFSNECPKCGTSLGKSSTVTVAASEAVNGVEHAAAGSASPPPEPVLQRTHTAPEIAT